MRLHWLKLVILSCWELNFRFTESPVDTEGAFRAGLYQTFSTHTSGDAASTNRFDDVGYGFTTNPGRVSSDLTHLFSEDSGDEILQGPNTSPHPMGLVTIGTGDSWDLGTTLHRGLLRITRQANGDLAMVAQIDSFTAATNMVAASDVLTYSFNELGIADGTTVTTPFFINLVYFEVYSHVPHRFPAGLDRRRRHVVADFARLLRRRWTGH